MTKNRVSKIIMALSVLAITGCQKDETSPLVSDPSHIKSSDELIGISSHSIGENYGGGIIFYLDATGQHGLIAATQDLGIFPWNAGTNTYTLAYSDEIGTGKINTKLIVASQGEGDGNMYAAKACDEYSVTIEGITYSDWYLPSMVELNLLYQQKNAVGGFIDSFYWSSIEFRYLLTRDTNNSWAASRHFKYGVEDASTKSDRKSVRAIRAF